MKEEKNKNGREINGLCEGGLGIPNKEVVSLSPMKRRAAWRQSFCVALTCRLTTDKGRGREGGRVRGKERGGRDE